MTPFIVRPIPQKEAEHFAGIGCDAAHAADCKQYLDKMFAAGSMRSDWCFVAQQGEQLIGRIAGWGLPAVGKPLDFVLLDLPWERDDYMAIGTALVNAMCTLAAEMGGVKLGHVLDTPAVSPQWQNQSARRQALLAHLGFQVERKTNRFEWIAASPDMRLKPESAAAHKASQLHYRSLAEVGQEAFVQAVMRVSEGTFDRYIREERERLGAWEQAKAFFAELQLMNYEPEWWQLAYDREGALIGLVMPTAGPAFATIGYIGVVPEQRGRGYVHALLDRGTKILLESGATTIRTDTDVDNEPMAQAFLAAGYRSLTVRCEYMLKI